MDSDLNNRISCLEAFKAMQCFLENYYEQTKSDDVGSLLGGLELNITTMTTRDPAALHDWIKCVQKITNLS